MSDETPLGPQDTPQSGQDPKLVTLTQEALDAAFAERANRAAKNAIGDLFKKYGLVDEDALKGVIEGYTEHQKSLKSLQEQLQTDLESTKNRLTEAEQARDTAAATLEAYMLRTAVQSAAQTAGFLPEALVDIWLLVSDTGELFELLKADTEKLAVTGAQEVVKKVAEMRPHWLEKRSAGPPPGRGVTPVPKPEPRKDGASQPLVRF